MTADMPWQGTAVQDRDALRLIPPLAEEFTAGQQAREWALENRYLLADGIPPCAHGLYLMASCPLGSCRTNFRWLDHARIWVPAEETPARPFLLSHPYPPKTGTYSPEAGQRGYARAHGLRHVTAYPGDDWYGHGTYPVRIMLPLPLSWPLWPIEHTIAVLLATQPTAWPASPLPGAQDSR